MQRSPGATIGSYEIRSVLGKGGMGEVYLAHDRKLVRDVAVKTLPVEFSGDLDRLARLQREARMLAALNHPNIAAIYGLEESEGDSFLVLELVEGETLAEWLQRKGPLPWNEALSVASQMAEGLEAAHAKGITHRDIKPANVKITPEGRVKILDFGLAKAMSPGLGSGDDAPTQATGIMPLGTEVGMVLGTPAYMSPEQARGGPVDQRTDIWAFGCVLYETLTGKRAFEGQSVADILGAVMAQEPDWDALSGTPERIRELLRQCLQKHPDERLRSMTEARTVIAEVQAGRRGVSRRFIVTIAGMLAAATVGAFALNVSGLRDRFVGTAPRIRSIAVLPLRNLSGDPEQEYFSDGMTESLIGDLAKFSSLKVISRTSAMTYKSSNKPLKQIAAELGVDLVLEGSALRANNRIRVSTQLIDARTDQNLWADTYDRDFADVLLVQSEVARAVVMQIGTKVTPAEQARLNAARRVNPEAHNAYLEGQFLALRPTRPNLDAAQKYFESALEKDPNYALAHAGMAFVWMARQQLGFAAPQDSGPRVISAVQKALALDSSLPQAHYTLALQKGWVEWDFSGAETSFRKSIELDPNYPDARIFYGRLLLILKRPKEGMAQFERALELDPLNALFRTTYGQALLALGRHDDAIAQARLVLAADPGNFQAKGLVRNANISKGIFKETLESILKDRIARGDQEFVEAMRPDFERGRYREAARAAAEVAERRWRNGGNPQGIGPLFAMAGLPEKWLEFLEWSYEQHFAGLPEELRTAARHFPQLERDPRYQTLLKRLGLP
jgi:eukaryotic-like serine/threonine-protein kinase